MTRDGSGDVGDIGDIVAADVAAAAAVAAISADVKSQHAALNALQALGATLPPAGVLHGLWAAYVHERQAALVAFHERRIAAAVAGGDYGDVDAAYDDAIAFAKGVGADDDEVARLRERKALGATAPATQALPRPFFARFLEQQER